jgi:hypothetical protein
MMEPGAWGRGFGNTAGFAGGLGVCVGGWDWAGSNSWGTGALGVVWLNAIVGERKIRNAKAVALFLDRANSSRENAAKAHCTGWGQG